MKSNTVGAGQERALTYRCVSAEFNIIKVLRPGAGAMKAWVGEAWLKIPALHCFQFTPALRPEVI